MKLIGGDNLNEEYRQALKELRRTENNLKEVDKKFHEVALLEYQAAGERVMAIIREAKVDEKSI